MQPAWILEIQSYSFSHSAKLVTRIPIITAAHFIQVIKTKKPIKPPEIVPTQSLDFFFTLSQTHLIIP